jgi:antitoxin component HigA of HigAB toxin-antitoxin module
MDTEKIIRLGQELQTELGFHPVDGITNQEQYDEVLKLVDILADDDISYNKNWALLDVLTPLIERYDDNEAN